MKNGLILFFILILFAKLNLAWLLLSAAISTPLAIAILVATAIYNIQKIRDEIAGLKLDIEGVTESHDDLWDIQQRRLKKLEEQYGKNSKEVKNYRMEMLETWKETSKAIDATMPFQRLIEGIKFVGSSIVSPFNTEGNPWEFLIVNLVV